MLNLKDASQRLPLALAGHAHKVCRRLTLA